MDVDICYDFQEPINLEELYEKYETYNVKQLAVVIRTFNSNRTTYDKTSLLKKETFRTSEQEKQFDKFSKYFIEEWPWLTEGKCKHKGANELSIYERNKNKKNWSRELKKFNQTCHSNNELYYTDDVLTKIKDIIKNNSTYDKNARGNEQIVCECGCLSLRKNLSAHKKSKIHERNMAITKEITAI
jgi:hypothetical protein